MVSDFTNAGNIKIRNKYGDLSTQSRWANGHWEKLDGRDGYWNRKAWQNQVICYVAIGSGINGCAYVGIEEMTLKSDFYKGGTIHQ